MYELTHAEIKEGQKGATINNYCFGFASWLHFLPPRQSSNESKLYELWQQIGEN